MNFDVVLNELSKHVDAVSTSDNFAEFNGNVRDNNGTLFEVEGCVELFPDNTLSYSVVATDVDSGVEYDGDIGSFSNMTEFDVPGRIAYILSCDFIKLAEQKGETKMSKEFEVIEEIGLATMDVRVIKIDGKYYWQQWDKLEGAYIPYLDDLTYCDNGFDTYEEVIDDAQGTDDNQVLWDLGSR